MATGRQGRARGISLIRVRRWLLGGVILLLLVLAGLIGFARYEKRRLLADLPRRLGIDIKSETNGYTFSQSVKGRTLFTVHAAKAIQRANGKTTLHDVAITLYGPPGSNRTDSIRSAAFEYDQPNGVIKADGEVHLDLAAPAQAGMPVKADARHIIVTTSGLVLLQKLGVAATDKPLHIVYGDLMGDAVGADYESDTGVLRLRRDVHVDGRLSGQTMHVDAEAAELDRGAYQGTFHRAHIRDGGNQASGDVVKLVAAKGGGIQSVTGEGHAVIQTATGTRAEAPHLQATLNNAGKVQIVTMAGGVQLAATGGSGFAQNAVLHFNAAGLPTDAVLQHAVQLKQTDAPGNAGSTLTADHLTAQLMQTSGKHTVLRDAVATGNAVLRSTSIATRADISSKTAQDKARRSTTVVTATTLHAYTSQSGDVRYISSLDGNGARIEQTDDAGDRRTSTGDLLHATLQSPVATGSRKGAGGSLQTVLQTGHVIIDEHKPAEQGAKAQDSHATADRAEFDAATQQLILTGSPVVSGSGVQLAAKRVVLAQGGGETRAEGDVRGTLVQENASGRADPLHVLADHAALPASGTAATFFGGARPARLWNSSAQLDAPEIDLDRARGLLRAHGTPHDEVHLLMAAEAANHSAPRVGDAVTSRSLAATSRPGGPVRITGQELRMTGETPAAPGRAEMFRTVRLASASGDVTADTVTAVLHRPAAKSQSNAAVVPGVFDSGSVESLTAEGDVHLKQPGRTGTGSRLIYTAAEDRYELTGTPSSPPAVSDSLRGNLTGTSLIFHGTGDSVEVAGAPGRRVHTEAEAGSRKH